MYSLSRVQRRRADAVSYLPFLFQLSERPHHRAHLAPGRRSELVNQFGKTLEGIISSVNRVTGIVAEITVTSQEQAGGIE